MILTRYREAGRCIKILETLSLRGNFWPGACASALRDLQKALARKFVNGSLDATRIGLSPKTSEMRGLTDTPNPNSIGVQNSRTSLKGSSLPSDGTLRATESVSPSITNPAFQTTSSQRSQISGPSNEHDVRRPATSISQTNTAASFQTTQPPYVQQEFPSDFTLTPGINGLFDTMGDQFDGVGDIFQLMDASYQLGEQMFEPAYGGRY